ncbi:MAG: hypothetical protein A4E19_20175 [Nitrospira sp. SG-bin1]|nr:MAG: hypothetical protein A4E19_20175 [Nitrospira sp. SG-bin1]
MQADGLQKQIVQWLEERRKLLLKASQLAGIPPSVEISRPVVTNFTETGFSSSQETVQVTPLVIPAFAFSLREKTAPSTEDIQKSPADALHKAYGERCKVWTPFSKHNFERNPLEWISEALLSRIELEYIRSLATLKTPNRSVAESLAKDAICLIQSDTINFVTALPLAGIKLSEESIESNNIRLRKISSNELARIADLSADQLWLYYEHKGVRPPFPRVVSERSVLEVRTTCSKTVQPQAGLYPKKVILALALLGFELHGESLASTWTEPGPSLTSGGQKFVLGRNGGTRDCTADHLRRAERVARVIPDGAVSSPQNRKEVVLHRFMLGNAEENASDKLIDFVIAIEGFLLPPGKEGEYRFKFGLYGAWYLATDQTEREILFKKLQEIYDMRSIIVHGSVPESEPSIREKAANARELAAKFLIKALEQGWPSHETLKQLALGV